jgi:cytochrome c1
MWIPPGFVYLGFALYFAGQWISGASKLPQLETSMRWRAASVPLGIALAAALILGAAGGNYLRDRQQKSYHAIRMTRGEPDKAARAIRQYGCAACHDIPGVQSPGGLAGPSLSGMAQRLYVGGAIENSPDNLVRWIVNPQQFRVNTAMPATGISESEARNVAAYLYEH